MHLTHPYILWLLLLLPPLAWWWLRQRRAALRYPNALALGQLSRGQARIATVIRLSLLLGVLACLIVGLARPRWPDEQTRIPAQGMAIQMVLDVSGSMNEKDFAAGPQKLSRLEAAKSAFREFVRGDDGQLAGRLDDLIGLTTFAARVEDSLPPTLSHSVLLKVLADAQPVGVPPDSATNIGDAILQAAELLRRSRPERKIMVLLTDGEHNVPPDVVADALKPRQAARIAQALGIRVYPVYVGPGEGQGTPEDNRSAKAAQEALNDVAIMTGGRAFRAQDAAALAEACGEIDQLERTPIESFQYYRYHEAYPWVGLLAVVFLMGILCWEGSRWCCLP